MTHPVFELIGYIESDLRNVNSRLTELRAHLAAENLQPVVLPECPVCGPLHLPPTVTIAEHMRNVHELEAEAAPVPEPVA